MVDSKHLDRLYKQVDILNARLDRLLDREEKYLAEITRLRDELDKIKSEKPATNPHNYKKASNGDSLGE